jgi:predicted RNA-binding Zn ribbon-like protein
MDIALVPMWSSICAEGMARMIGAGYGDRFGTCEAPDCDRVFFDLSRNASRRFCSTTCQNRVKAAAFRLRQSSRSPRSSPRKPKH